MTGYAPAVLAARRALWPWLAVLMAGCSTIHGVKPVGKGVVRPELSFGGPITEVYGAPIPIPLTQLGATYGVDDKTDVHVAWHTSAAAFYNLFGADAGASRELLTLSGARPRVMADLTVLGFAGDNEPGGAEGGFRLFVQPTATASWDWGKHRRETTYIALTAMFQPFPSARVVPALAIGSQFAFGRRLSLTAEAKWIAFYKSNVPVVPTYYAPGNIGALGFNLGLGYAIGKLGEPAVTAPVDAAGAPP